MNGDKSPSDVNYQEEYTNLKKDYDDLVLKHNTLEQEYGAFKLNNDVEKDIRVNNLALDDDDIKLLKALKNDNLEAYDLLIDKFKLTKQSKLPLFTKSIGGSDKDNRRKEKVTFSSAIEQMRGGK